MKSGGRRHKNILILGIGAGVFLLLCWVGLSSFTYLTSCPLPDDSPPVHVEVFTGTSTRDIAESLHNNRIIRNPFLFRVVSRILKADGKMQAGEYIFEPGAAVWDVIEVLVKGDAVYYTFTVREGLSVEEIAALVEEKGFGSKGLFLQAVTEHEALPPYVTASELELTTYSLEGYLFPDTYFVRKGVTERELVAMMLDRFSQVFTEELKNRAEDLGLTAHQVSTLASIVEKEAVADEERPTIAAVYLNRIKIRMKLDADPTVLYALGRFNGNLLWRELDVDSPYNTYRNPGLPPGPISNFGKASLEAVLNPSDVEYLYFVSKNDGTGTHAFSQTLNEHNRKVAQYLGN